MVIYLNKPKIQEKEYDLIHFKGFIPMDFNYHIDMKKRNDYLKRINKFDEVKKEQIKIRTNAKNSDDTDVFFEKVLKKWIADNPQFKDLIIEE